MSMEVKFLGTGSAGNAIVIQSNVVTVMVDCGIPKTRIEKRLLEAGVRPDAIDAIFLTHAHGDHVKGLPMAAKYNIPVYASAGTWKTIDFKGCSRRLSMMVDFSGLTVDYFQTHHDDYDSLGFVIDDEKRRVSVCLDTGHIDAQMLDAMRGSDVYILESNYDEKMLEASKYHDALKRRISGDMGHLSNQQAAEALAQLVTGRGEKIYLCHLSTHNNIPALAQATVTRALKRKGIHNFTVEVF